MPVTFRDDLKSLPTDQLYRLFCRVGWADGTDGGEMLASFARPFERSSIVVSAWDGEALVGTARALTDFCVRAVLLDVAVDPAYQRQGVGRQLVTRCMGVCPDCEWAVQTDAAEGFYRSLGFVQNTGVFLRRPSRWF